MAGERAPAASFATHGPEATEALGEALGAVLAAGPVVGVIGELGAGKTTLVRGLARGLGVADAVQSPTFTLMHEHRGRVPVFHFDAWMSGREALFLEGGGAEYLGGSGVALVEWADRIEAWLPRPWLRIELSPRTREERRIEVALVPPDARRGPETGLEALERGLAAARRALAGPENPSRG